METLYFHNGEEAKEFFDKDGVLASIHNSDLLKSTTKVELLKLMRGDSREKHPQVIPPSKKTNESSSLTRIAPLPSRRLALELSGSFIPGAKTFGAKKKQTDKNSILSEIASEVKEKNASPPVIPKKVIKPPKNLPKRVALSPEKSESKRRKSSTGTKIIVEEKEEKREVHKEEKEVPASKRSEFKFEDVQKDILAWDCYSLHSVQVDHNQDLHIPVEFDSWLEYCTVFLPLVLEELRSQLIQSVEELPPEYIVLQPQELASEPGIKSITAYSKIDPKKPPEIIHEDIGILYRGEESNPLFYLFAIVNSVNRFSSHGTSYLQLELRVSEYVISQYMTRVFRPDWKFKVVSSLIPVHRELRSLYSISQLKMSKYILHPPKWKTQPKSKPVTLSNQLEKILSSQFNKSQIQAVTKCRTEEGFIFHFYFGNRKFRGINSSK